MNLGLTNLLTCRLEIGVQVNKNCLFTLVSGIRFNPSQHIEIKLSFLLLSKLVKIENVPMNC